jgi:hypothetical protein
MLINLSNHPSKKWESKQNQEAIRQFGSVTDLPFPAIDPEWTTTEIAEKSEVFFNKIALIFDECANEPKQNAVHIQGEFIFVYQLVSLLKSSNIKCVASTSTRNVVKLGNGKKIVSFSFVQFREY